MKKIFLFFVLYVLLFSEENIYVFTGDGRRNYQRNEKIEVCLNFKKDIKGEMKIFLKESEEKDFWEICKKYISFNKNETMRMEIPCIFLKEGEYQMKVIVEEDTSNILYFKIAKLLPKSNFLIGAMENPETVYSLGGNLSETTYYQNNKIGEDDPLPLNYIENAFDKAIGLGINLVNYSHFGGYVMHQPFIYWSSWCDPDIEKLARQNTQLMAQRLRRWPNFIWNCPLDEPGLGYGIDEKGIPKTIYPDIFQRISYEREKNKKLPENIFELQKEDFMEWYKWRREIIGRFYLLCKNDFRKIPNNILWAPDIYAGWAINDGAYPTNGLSSDIRNTHTFWTNSCQEVSSYLSIEKAFFRDKPISFALNGWLIPEPFVYPTYHILMNFLHNENVKMVWWLNYINKEYLREIFNRTTKLGDFFLKLNVCKPKIAILYSFTELANRHYENKNASSDVYYDIAISYFFQISSAYNSITRANYPADIIIEEEIENGYLEDGIPILFLVGIKHNLPEKVNEKIMEFMKKGGYVLCDSQTSININGMERTNINFLEIYEKIKNLKTINEKEKIINENVAKIKTEIEKHIGKPEIETEVPSIIIGKHSSGEGIYYFLINYNLSEKVSGGKLQISYEPLNETKIIFNKLPKKYFIYSLNGKNWDYGKQLILKDKILNESFENGEMKIFCILRKKIENLDLSIKSVKEGISIEFTVMDKNKKQISAAFPIKILIIEPDGKVKYEIYRSTENGIYKEIIPFGINEKNGNWKFEVEELFTGKKVSKGFNFKGISKDIELNFLPDVSFYDIEAQKIFLKNKNRFLIVVNKKEKQEGEKLFKILKNKGFDVKLIEEDELIKKAKYPKVFPAIRKIGYDPTEWKNLRRLDGKWENFTIEEREKFKKEWEKLENWLGTPGYPPHLPDAYEIEEDLILIGTDKNSLLINALNRSGVLKRVSNSYYPGKNNAIIQYVWSPFYLNKDVILITSSEIEGLKKGIDAFYKNVVDYSHSISP